MCNRARMLGEPKTIFERFGSKWLTERPMVNRFNPVELNPRPRAWVVRQNERGRGVDVMRWDVLNGLANFPMTNVRNLALPQWRRLAEKPENRCLIPLTEFCEWTPGVHDLGDGKKPIKGEMWFAVTDQPIFAVAGFWQSIKGDGGDFAMVTSDSNELVAPVHPKAMITVLEEADWDRWLTSLYEDAVALQRPYDPARMTVRGPVFPTRGALGRWGDACGVIAGPVDRDAGQPVSQRIASRIVTEGSAKMPRYFFNSGNGHRDDDHSGTELPDHGAARVHAIKYAGDVMSSEPGVLWDGQDFKVEVMGEAGARLFTILCHAIDEPASGQA